MMKCARHCTRTLMVVASCTVAVPVLAQAPLKTAAACNAEYKVQKPALKTAKEKKRDFIAACRALPAGTPTPVASAAATPKKSPAPQPAPASQASPTQSLTTSPAPRTATAAPGESACANGYAHLPASHTTAQFCDEAQARSRCPGQPIVWVNTRSKVFHVAGSNTYGHTKEGAYMCEADATAEGDRMSKNGH